MKDIIEERTDKEMLEEAEQQSDPEEETPEFLTTKFIWAVFTVLSWVSIMTIAWWIFRNYNHNH